MIQHKIFCVQTSAGWCLQTCIHHVPEILPHPTLLFLFTNNFWTDPWDCFAHPTHFKHKPRNLHHHQHLQHPPQIPSPPLPTPSTTPLPPINTINNTITSTTYHQNHQQKHHQQHHLQHHRPWAMLEVCSLSRKFKSIPIWATIKTLISMDGFMDDSLMILILILISMVPTQECNELGRLITHLPHQVESDVFSRTIVEVQNKSIPNVLDFVYSTLASVNKHRWPAPHPLDVRYHSVLDEPSTELIIIISDFTLICHFIL